MLDKLVLALPGMRVQLAIAAALTVLQAIAIIGQAYALASALTGLWLGDPVADQALWVALFLACFIGRQVVLNPKSRIIDRYAHEQSSRLRDELLAKIFSQGPALIQRRGTGSVASLAIEGIDRIDAYLAIIVPKMVAVLIIPLVLLAFIIPHDWVSGLIAGIMFPFIVLYMVLLGKTAKAEAAKQYAQFEVLSNHFIDSLRGLATHKLFGRSKAYGDSIFQTSERFREVTVKTLRVATLSGAVLDLFATLSLAGVAIMLGFRLVDGTIALFPALLTLILVPEYFKPVREFASDYHASLDGKNALADVTAIIAEPDAKPEQVQLGEWGEDSELHLRDLVFSYRESTGPALDGIDAVLRGFSRVGIIGASGSGKSTLVGILAGFSAPTSGGFSVAGCVTGPGPDDRAGSASPAAPSAPVELASLHQDSWQRQVIYIPQNPYIFHATLRENVAFYTPDADEIAVQQAIDAVGLRELADELPRGIDTLIGEGERALSGGQAQRIAIARALLDRSRRIILFDEPTAHLDIETEYELKARMLPLMEDRLVIFATHRLHWMDDMDQVIVLDHGRIAAIGTPQEVMAK